MASYFLLPHRFKKAGWILLAISTSLWIISFYFPEQRFPLLEGKTFAFIGSSSLLENTQYLSMIHTNLTLTLIGSLFIIGGVMVAFSKELVEDEFIMRLRLVSFQWAVLINYLILFFLFLFIYGIEFLYVMMYNMFTIIILFIIIFHYKLFKTQK